MPDIVDQLISDTAHLEFGSLIRDLSVTDKVITPASQPTNPVTPILGTDTVRLIENQNELNMRKQVKWDNTKFRDRKRKSEIQSIPFDNFKRRKLAEVGNRGAFDTERKLDVETAGLLTGYTDMLSSQPFYKATLTVTKATMIPGNSETTTVDTWVTRSWDKDYNCTDCRPSHSIFKNTYFALMLTDQHGVAKVPCQDGICIASCKEKTHLL